MDFVDWCSHVLNTLIAALDEPENTVRSSLDTVRLFHRLFGEDAPSEGNHGHDAMHDALKALKIEGMVKGNGIHWKVTRQGKDRARDMKPLWGEICSIGVEPEEEELLRYVNGQGQQTEGSEEYVWLQQLGSDDLVGTFDLDSREAAYNKFRRAAEGLRDLGLIELTALAGFHLNLKPTYRGVAWETRRGMLRRCDVFISHSTDERTVAISLQEFLQKAFGEDLKIFVSSDYHSIPGGKVWFAELLEALNSAPVTLLLLSQSSIERRWINFEAGVGIGAGNLVIPLAVTGFSKGEVGHPLSELQARALSDAKDVSGVLSDISTHLGRPFGNVDTETFAAADSAAGGAKLEATINHVPEQPHDGYKEHKLIVGLTNNSPKTLSDHRVEAEVPNAVLNQSTGYGAEIESRRTAEYRYFRAYGKDRRPEVLHPGDRIAQFFTVPLLVPPDAEESGALEKRIVIKVFAGDVMTQQIEKTVKEILDQPPNFG